MRTSGSPSREVYYDRQSAVVMRSFEGIATEPHASTSRLSYTVPAGKKAFLDMLQGSVYRSLAATAGGLVKSLIAVDPASGVEVNLGAAVLYAEDNAVKDRDSFFVGGSITLLAGDKVTIYTEDGSTGGECNFQASFHAIEFDA